MQLTQRLLLQTAEFAEQRGQFARLVGRGLGALGETLERLALVARQLQGLQQPAQFGKGLGHLARAHFPALLGIEHGALQARNQLGEVGVAVVTAEDVAQFDQAGVHRRVVAFGGQAAAHEATTHQVQAVFPPAFQAFEVLEALQVFAFPAFDVRALHPPAPKA